MKKKDVGKSWDSLIAKPAGNKRKNMKNKMMDRGIPIYENDKLTGYIIIK